MLALTLERGAAVGAQNKVRLDLLVAVGARLLFFNVLQHGLFGEFALVGFRQCFAGAEQKI